MAAAIQAKQWGLPARLDGRRYSIDAVLSVLQAPEIAVTAVTASSITVSITGQANNTTLVPQIRVADTGEYENRTGIAADASTYTYTGLADDTEYELRMQVSDE